MRLQRIGLIALITVLATVTNVDFGFPVLGQLIYGIPIITPKALSQPAPSQDAFEFFYIPSDSALPTLQVNDSVLVDKRAYRSRLPKRGEIIVFKPTGVLRQQGFSGLFIKRIIGLPGETVEVKDGKVYINNQPLQENYIAEAPNYQFGLDRVPPNSYFVLGDNRNNSIDSHIWGFVPQDLIIGQVVRIAAVNPLV